MHVTEITIFLHLTKSLELFNIQSQAKLLAIRLLQYEVVTIDILVYSHAVAYVVRRGHSSILSPKIRLYFPA